MGRHFEVRAAAMAGTAAKKSALYMRASKEIYMAAKSGLPDPVSNLALRSAIEKYHKNVTKDVIERAIKKAAGGSAEAYSSGRYEFFGPGKSYIIVDSLTDNVNRAFVEIRTVLTRHGGHMGAVAFNFTETGVIVFKGTNRDQVEEALILNDVDVREVSEEDGTIECLVEPTFLGKAKIVLIEMGISEFEVSELTMLPNEKVTLVGEDVERFQDLIDKLDELQDVQNYYHNVDL
ncbi:MAG: YebC/PmpR family DNA-binding transcriptional regulator [Firmicutes bacterium]|nr:YebC/PmpR family DNA-binding transcriptional regulator [Bacillota bacterium]